MRSKTIALAVAVAALGGAAFSPGASATPQYDYGCGVKPGSGYVNYIRVANMTCRHGKKVSRKVVKKFCAEHNGCSFETDLGFYKGTTYRNGWRCKVAVGYEYYRAKCRRGKMRFVHMTGA